MSCHKHFKEKLCIPCAIEKSTEGIIAKLDELKFVAKVEEEPSCERCKMKNACSLKFNTRAIRFRDGSVLSYKVSHCDGFTEEGK